MKLTETSIMAALLVSDDLRGKRWRGHANALAGHCYVASEAFYHAIGKKQGYKPAYVKFQGTTHWFLVDEERLFTLDLTYSQFYPKIPPWNKAVLCGFLTKKPSKRTRILLSRARKLQKPFYHG